MDRRGQRRAGTLILPIALMLSSDWALAQKPDSAASRDEAGVIQAGKAYVAALERGDARALADYWTATGTYTDETGHAFKVHDLSTHNPTAVGRRRPGSSVRDLSVRFVTPDVAIEEGYCTIDSEPGTQPLDGRFSAVWVRSQGRWKLESLTEWRQDANTNGNQLSSLDPFVGEWSGKVGEQNLNITSRWNSTKTFLYRNFKFQIAGHESIEASQIIGWDPASQQIKSWLFSSDGSRGEGIWTLEGTAWMVRTRGIQSNGAPFTSTHVLTFQGKDRLVSKVLRGEEQDQESPQIAFELSRKSP